MEITLQQWAAEALVGNPLHTGQQIRLDDNYCQLRNISIERFFCWLFAGGVGPPDAQRFARY
jgi:hypothetical protein